MLSYIRERGSFSNQFINTHTHIEMRCVQQSSPHLSSFPLHTVHSLLPSLGASLLVYDVLLGTPSNGRIGSSNVKGRWRLVARAAESWLRTHGKIELPPFPNFPTSQMLTTYFKKFSIDSFN